MQANGVDPYTATREVFTNDLIRPIPDNAAADWKDLAEKLQVLLKKLGYHQAMAPNLQQTFMTPAASKNKIYFMWDFVARTLGYLYMVPCDLQGLPKQFKDMWQDVIGRSTLAASLILDRPPGMLDQMTERTHPGQMGVLHFGQRPVFGDEITGLARQLLD